MGMLNITPDSFSDGGKYNSLPAAIQHANEMINHGAMIIDVGGESANPKAAIVSTEEELHRVIPVVEALSQRFVPQSISFCGRMSFLSRESDPLLREHNPGEYSVQEPGG
ncbi:TPA: dihydropteroate synthase [Salmonella enterica subsp. enterica serovar Thompson]